ncbi:MAG: AMP-binding protein, partial [Candidatus Promineifilaceae bacterium]
MLNLPNYETRPKLAPQYPVNPYPTRPNRTPAHHRSPQRNNYLNRTQRTFSKEAMSNLSPADQQLFERFGQGPLVELPYHAIHHPFEVYAAANPEAVAAEHQGEAITYGELNRQANRLAAVLTQHGVSNGDRVALFL